jgi:predicted CoA-substrate-specific enzyme activase
MNDRCAAGTGRFLEMVATRLGIPLGELGALVCQSQCPAPISSMCAVFAETEIVGLLAGGRHPADIVTGVQAAISQRMGSMAGRNLVGPICFTGGVALVPGMAQALQKVLGHPVSLPPQPLLTGALGAALLAVKA